MGPTRSLSFLIIPFLPRLPLNILYLNLSMTLGPLYNLTSGNLFMTVGEGTIHLRRVRELKLNGTGYLTITCVVFVSRFYTNVSIRMKEHKNGKWDSCTESIGYRVPIGPCTPNLDLGWRSNLRSGQLRSIPLVD